MHKEAAMASVILVQGLYCCIRLVYDVDFGRYERHNLYPSVTVVCKWVHFDLNGLINKEIK